MPFCAQPLAVRVVDPRARDDPGAVLRADVVLVQVDDRVDRIGGDQPLLDEERLERRGPDGDVVVVVVVVGRLTPAPGRTR